jgi:predicted RecB family nuclease
MKLTPNAIRLSATDLGNNLLCGHLTFLDHQLAMGFRQAPKSAAPDAEVMRQRGLAHEEAYVVHLAAAGLTVRDLRNESESSALRETVAAMKAQADVIVQAALEHNNWYGRADVLRMVTKPSNLGSWSYEVYDCKLAVETKASTILQLALYSDLLEVVQGVRPEFMHVISPGVHFLPESHRVLDYSAYHRTIRSRLEALVTSPRRSETYPEPTEHCDVCRWGSDCRKRRRDDDHLSLVAGITSLQRKELVNWNVTKRF